MDDAGREMGFVDMRFGGYWQNNNAKGDIQNVG
jgi:hypothetical protein